MKSFDQRRLLSGLALGLLLLFAANSQAKTLYVNASTGNDATTWANNGPSNPWRTIGRAAWGSTNRSSPNASQAAQAGDVVNIAAGTYSSSLNTGQGRWDVLYNPVNGGTAGNPITFVADGTVAIRAQSWGGPVVGARFVDYIIWFGPFLIDENFIDTEPDTGPVIFSGTTGSGIDGAIIHGAGQIWADNHVGVRFEPCNQCFVRNTVIDNFTSAQGATSRNGAAIMLYDSDDTLIENNEFFNCGAGIYIKGTAQNSPQERTIVRFNVIRNMLSSGIIFWSSTGGQVYQNILHDNPIALFISGSSGATEHSVNDVIANNTIDGGGDGWGVYYSGQWEGATLVNNIVTNVQAAHVSEGWSSPGADATIEHNVYWSTNTFASFTGGNYSLASWSTNFLKGLAAPVSIQANPGYVNRSAGDFHLDAGSPARIIGMDLLDLDNDGSTVDIVPAGAYVTGNEMIGTGSIRPAPPLNLSAS